jgi:hypothetical protein
MPGKNRCGFIACLVEMMVILAACQSQPLQPETSAPATQMPQPVTQTLAVTATPSVTSTPTLLPTHTVTATATATATATPQPALRFAVIGDYGLAGPAEEAVARMILRWEPDLMITTGDNNYPDGSAETIDANIGQYFHSFIYPYLGSYGQGAEINRFFPSLGNHDWTIQDAQPYLDYFTLPGNERYYDFTWGPVHFFALDSDTREPDKVGRSSAQAAWLQQALAGSTAPWKVIYTHYPPYSSGYYGSTDWIQWPFAEWGADVVLAGHDHDYERLMVEGIPYFVNGLGGGEIYYFTFIHPGSLFRYSDSHGAMLVEATPSQITFQFYAIPGLLIDTFVLSQPDAGE